MFSSNTTQVAAAGAADDPYFKYVPLLLSGDGTNGAQNNTFIDGSTNNFTITRNGNTTQGSFSPYTSAGSSWSNYFGGSGNYVVSNAAVFTSTTTTFTVEGWIYMTAAAVSTSNIPALIGDMQPASTAAYWTFGPLASGALSFYWYDGASKSATSSGTISLNTWTHVAVSVNANAISLYINGVQQTLSGTTTLTNRTGSNSYVALAQFSNSNSLFTGYLSNISVLSGTAKYSGNFTPSTTPLTTGTTNQVLLFGASNSFADSNTATTAKTFTITGTPSVQRFNPFNPTSAYSTSVIGGSGYFDGSGDYLNFSPSTSFAFGTGDFTIEFWMNTNGSSAAGAILDSSTNGSYWAIRFSGTTIYYQSASGLVNLLTGTVSTANQSAWTHIVISRVSGTTKIFSNGTQIASGTDATNYALTTTYRVGLSSDSAYYTGYISDIRVVKGSGVTSVTVPTAPLTAITNTSLLLNYTNAGIYDSAMMNDLETVGNAQISTAQKKYGTASMYFNGTGSYLIMPEVLTGKFGTGDFTVEYWDYHGSQSTNYATQVGTLSSASGSGTWRFGTLTNNGGIYFSYYNGSAFVDVQFGSTAYNDSTWRHFAISRQNGTVRAFVNGTQVGTSQTLTIDLNSSNRVVVGAELLTPSYFNGYIDDLRITKGYARYTSNFTAPTAALPNY